MHFYLHTLMAFNSIISGTIGPMAIHEIQSRPAVFADEDGPGAGWQTTETNLGSYIRWLDISRFFDQYLSDAPAASEGRLGP